MARKYGFSFSWKRAVGISSAKRKISRATGIPLTRSGRRRKVGAVAGCLLPVLAVSLILILCACVSGQSVKEGKAITEWEPFYVGDTEGGANTRLYWSKASIRRSEDIIKVWIKAEFDAPTDIIGSSDGKLVRGIVAVREYMVLNCEQKVAGGDTEIVYFYDGRTQSREHFWSKNFGNEPARDDSFGYFIAEYFCERGSAPTVAPRLLTKPKSTESGKIIP